MKPTVPEGAKVKVRHSRWTPGADPELELDLRPAREIHLEGGSFYPLGGATEAVVTLANGKEARGEATCRADEAFNKTIGRNIAIGRALKELGLINRNKPHDYKNDPGALQA